MLTLLAVLAVAAGAAVAWYRGAAGAGAALAVVLVALGFGAALVSVAMRKVRRDLHAPLSTLYAWALGMCSGDFSTRVPADGGSAYRKLAFHINRLSEALEGLANEMDDVVWRQTERLREKNASIELLYEVAASINQLDSIEEILRASARSMMEKAEARGAWSVCATQPARRRSPCVWASVPRHPRHRSPAPRMPRCTRRTSASRQRAPTAPSWWRFLSTTRASISGASVCSPDRPSGSNRRNGGGCC